VSLSIAVDCTLMISHRLTDTFAGYFGALNCVSVEVQACVKPH
jgi:hypothetical protein